MTVIRTGVVVIGAGAAGLAAARRLHERGIDVLVVEGRERIGGRAYCVRSHDGSLPVELGAEFIHGTPAATFALLRESGQIAIDEASETYQVSGDRAEPAPDVWEIAQSLLARVDVNGPDRSVEAFFESLPLMTHPAEQLDAVRALIEGFDAALTTDASIIGIAKEWRSNSNQSQFRPVNGYGPLVQYLGRTVNARTMLRTRIDEVRWNAQGVRVRATRSGEPVEIEARRAVVTLPAGVLREQHVRFTPPLPQAKLDAIEAIAMGPVVKVVLDFRTPFWEETDGGRYRDVAFFQAPQCALRTVWTRLPQRTPLLVAWAGGGAVQRLRERGLDPIAAALGTCETLFPNADVRGQLRNAYYHDWQDDPFSYGAYSYLRVNGGNARDVLAQSVEATLFFAGEATASDDPGTVGGALASGYRAADELIALCR